MGASESNPETQGWRVLEVIPKGPMWDKGVVVYFDFIVGVNGYRLNTSSEEFWDNIKSKQGTEIVLTVFNYKTRIKRDITMTPNNEWGGDGLLGLVIVREDFTKCDQQCIRVLSVSANSPASRGALNPQTDYILGTPINAFASFSSFRDTISDFIDQPLPMYVYNSEEATVRLVEITPSSQWEGEGVLGCQVGDGYLHHIPSLSEEQQEIKYLPTASYVVSSSAAARDMREKDVGQEVSPVNEAIQVEEAPLTKIRNAGDYEEKVGVVGDDAKRMAAAEQVAMETSADQNVTTLQQRGFRYVEHVHSGQCDHGHDHGHDHGNVHAHSHDDHQHHGHCDHSHQHDHEPYHDSQPEEFRETQLPQIAV